jgi:hypothetical protein
MIKLKIARIKWDCDVRLEAYHVASLLEGVFRIFKRSVFVAKWMTRDVLKD